MSQNTKICSKCLTERSVADFSRQATSKDGLQPWCCECNQNYSLEHQSMRKRARALAGVSKNDWEYAMTPHLRSVYMDMARLGSTAGAAEKAKDHRGGFVYFLEHPRMMGVKIGRAFDPERRLQTFQTGCPSRAYVMSWVSDYCSDAVSFEAALHTLWAERRLRGEWFNLIDPDGCSIVAAHIHRYHHDFAEIPYEP